jgi:hypothetical protein
MRIVACACVIMALLSVALLDLWKDISSFSQMRRMDRYGVILLAAILGVLYFVRFFG